MISYTYRYRVCPVLLVRKYVGADFFLSKYVHSYKSQECIQFEIGKFCSLVYQYFHITRIAHITTQTADIQSAITINCFRLMFSSGSPVGLCTKAKGTLCSSFTNEKKNQCRKVVW
jgi:hypothetical protein